MTRSGKLLIYAPVPLIQQGDQLFLEGQACNGLRLWAEQFEHLTVMHPVLHEPVREGWTPIETIGSNLERIRILPLPTAYRPDQFFRNYRRTRDLIRDEIDKADYLTFAIGGLFGDWGSVACWQAHKMGRPFAVWTDRVESEVTRRTATEQKGHRRLRARLEHRPMWWWEKFIIRRATLGLFHGRDTYDTYAPFAQQAELVHNIHLKKSDHISPDALQSKIDGVASEPVRIVYAGRASAMKGPQDWLTVLERLDDAGVDFRATWLGDGPALPEMHSRVEALGLGDRVDLAGFVNDRDQVLRQLRQAHVFLFCHKTPESPRCLIEALASGAPIVGYESAFPRDLVSDHNGGQMVPLNDVEALSDAVIDLAKDRDTLSELIGNAARDGAPFDDKSVFHHRGEMIRQHL